MDLFLLILPFLAFFFFFYLLIVVNGLLGLASALPLASVPRLRMDFVRLWESGWLCMSPPPVYLLIESVKKIVVINPPPSLQLFA